MLTLVPLHRLPLTPFTTSALRRWPRPCSTSTSWPFQRLPLLAGRQTTPQVPESTSPSCSSQDWSLHTKQPAAAATRPDLEESSRSEQLHPPHPPPQQTPGLDQGGGQGALTENSECVCVGLCACVWTAFAFWPNLCFAPSFRFFPGAKMKLCTVSESPMLIKTFEH